MSIQTLSHISFYICQKKNMDKPAKIVQPNVITSARYEYSVIEKRIIYRIIGMVQQKMGVGMDETLFGEHIIRIPIKDVATNNNYNTVRQSAIALQQKVFSIDKGQGSWLNVGFVSSSEYDSKTGILEFEFSKKIIPYLVELADRKSTRLNSSHANISYA